MLEMVNQVARTLSTPRNPGINNNINNDTMELITGVKTCLLHYNSNNIAVNIASSCVCLYVRVLVLQSSAVNSYQDP